MAGALLRLVHSLERRRSGLPYTAQMELRAGGPDGRLLSHVAQEEHSARAWVVGAGDRVDLTAPGGLLPRHIAILSVPTPEGVLLRAITLHPDRAMAAFAQSEREPLVVGAIEAYDAIELLVDGYYLRVQAQLNALPTTPRIEGTAMFSPGEQLGFYQGSTLKQVGNVVSSISGPGGGGHAIPALVSGMPEPESAGTLVLHGRSGVHRLEPSWTDLRRGLLIGRSRRCVLGRGFDENDGLSRIHALCVMLDTGVFVFDLASRYGLRDVARPTRMLSAARLDDGTGCLIYGAGHLLFEP